MDVNELFKNFLEEIEQVVSLNVYNLWFSKIRPISLEGNTLKIVVPMDIHKSMLSENYKEYIDKAFINITGKTFNIEYFTEDELQETKENKPNKEVTEDLNEEWVTNLNPKFTFESFVVGESNRLAVVSAHAVAENPGSIHNPLFLYGRSGIGKTHLMHAIGNYISKNSDKKVLYVTSEQFVSDFIGINKKDENGTNFTYVDFFKQKYRNIDVLIIDDIQYLGGATETQKEFFHTFNTLYGDNKQIIISSDRSPDDLKILEDRLRTRFCWGLPVDIYPPDFELRVAILKKRIVGEAINKEIPDQVIEYMASNLGSDIRQLEGAVTRLVAYSTIMGSEIDLNLAIEALKDYINKGVSEKNNVNKIQKVVAEYFQISVEDLKSKKRNSNISFPRQIAMFLCRKFTDESFPKIGIEFGGKDHSTVMHSCEKIEREIKTNKDLADTIDKLEKDIH